MTKLEVLVEKMQQLGNRLNPLDEAIEKDLWDRLKSWDVLIDVDSKTVETVLRRMADRAKHWREEE